MTLREYLTENKLTLREFSKRVDIDQTQVSVYLNGRRLPSLENAYKIYKATKKKVKMEDWFNVNNNTPTALPNGSVVF